MKQFKKILALTLSLSLVLALAACSSGTSNAGSSATPTPAPAGDTNTPSGGEENTPSTPANLSADDIDDNMTAADGIYQLAFVTDVGSLKDKSFNEGTWNGVKLYAAANNMTYKYYQPANGAEATDDDRYNAMKAAADAGAEVVVCAGFLQGAALTKAAMEYPDTHFIFIDGWPLDDGNGNILTNVAPIAFKEEQPGYFVGYAAVMEGFTKLGFCGGGGGTNDACCRYGYGYVQGAAAAAEQKGVDVEINFTWQYGANFTASPELQTLANGWYQNGTEIIFACGGTIFDSVTAAASANDAYVIGVDVDQSFQSDTVVTSALKGIGEATTWAITKSYDGTWSDIGGVATSLGASEDATGLPTETWSMQNFSVAEYEELFQNVLDGTVVIDNDFSKMETTDWGHVTLNMI